MNFFILAVFSLFYVSSLHAKDHDSFLSEERTERSLAYDDLLPGQGTVKLNSETKINSWNKDTLALKASYSPNILIHRTANLYPTRSDTTKLVPVSVIPPPKSLNELAKKNNFTKNLLGHFITSPQSTLYESGIKSISYFNQFSGKKITSIRFIRLHPFGSSLQDTALTAKRWIEKTGNHLHMNTTRSKLRMQLLFKEGELVNPLLLAENEKLMRDLSYIEDVSFRLEPVENSPDEIKVIIISKDKFEYSINMSVNADNSDVEVANVNMFGLGHRLIVGLAQKNEYLPDMGFYSSYHINNMFGHLINSAVGISDTYLKKGWYVSIDKRFLTSNEVNAGGISFEHVSKYNYIAEDHPIELDTTVAYITGDTWFIHAFSNKKVLTNKTLAAFRYYHQVFDRTEDDSFGDSEFLRNHDFILGSLSCSSRNLYRNNLVYGYGVTEDIPYGYFYEVAAGLDKSQFGTWPYFKLSLSKAFIDKASNYFCSKIGLDGFIDNGVIKQGTMLASVDFFSKKISAFGDPFRWFGKIEFLGGINRFEEEYLTIDGRAGIRDFYTSDLKGNNRLKCSLELVRYLKWNFYGFKFTNYLFTDFAFLSDKLESILTRDFYAGIGAGLRIYNESLLFKIIDIL